MTKAENRAAAKAYAEEVRRKQDEEYQQAGIRADLEELDRLRRYLISHSRARVPADELITAIDDYVERLTGNRRTLHTQGHSIP
jgi:hypothetical protein